MSDANDPNLSDLNPPDGEPPVPVPSGSTTPATQPASGVPAPVSTPSWIPFFKFSQVDTRNRFFIIFLFAIVLFGVFLGYQFKPCVEALDKTGIFGTKIEIDAVLLWRFYLALIFGFCIILGFAIKDRWSGVFIDERNRMSLSRFQLVLWTALILSGFLVAALINLCVGSGDPLKIALDGELWALMGISSASLVGSGLIKSRKTTQQGDPIAQGKVANAAKSDSTEPAVVPGVPETVIMGRLVGFKSPKDASWLDMFLGEETGGYTWIDMGKVQMFIFTLTIWFTYATALVTKIAAAVHGSGGMHEFPPLEQSMLALLGISHAAYLGNKTLEAPRETGGQNNGASRV